MRLVPIITTWSFNLRSRGKRVDKGKFSVRLWPIPLPKWVSLPEYMRINAKAAGIADSITTDYEISYGNSKNLDPQITFYFKKAQDAEWFALKKDALFK